MVSLFSVLMSIVSALQYSLKVQPNVLSKLLSKIDKYFEAQLAVEIFSFWIPVLARDAQWMQVANCLKILRIIFSQSRHNGVDLYHL